MRAAGHRAESICAVLTERGVTVAPPWPAPKVDRYEALSAKYAQDCPDGGLPQKMGWARRL